MYTDLHSQRLTYILSHWPTFLPTDLLFLHNLLPVGHLCPSYVELWSVLSAAAATADVGQAAVTLCHTHGRVTGPAVHCMTVRLAPPVAEHCVRLLIWLIVIRPVYKQQEIIHVRNCHFVTWGIVTLSREELSLCHILIVDRENNDKIVVVLLWLFVIFVTWGSRILTKTSIIVQKLWCLHFSRWNLQQSHTASVTTWIIT